MGDFGIRVHPRLQDGPLWKLSPRALRLWLFLAMKAQHVPRTMLLSDGQRIRIARGQWLTSARKIRHELGKGSFSSITADLAELKDAGAITVAAIPRYATRNGGVTEPVTGGRYASCNGDAVMATLITVEGIGVVVDPVTESVTKDKELVSRRRDRQELELADRILAAEGR